MKLSKLTGMMPILLTCAILMAACGGRPPAAIDEPVEAEAPASASADDGFSDSIQPSIAHEIALREKLDDAIMDRFGYDEIRVNRSFENNYFSIKYALQNVPSGSAFYSEMENLFKEIFDFHLFGEHDNLDDWYEWNDEDPDEMSVAFTFEDMNFYWIVTLVGNDLVFGYV